MIPLKLSRLALFACVAVLVAVAARSAEPATTPNPDEVLRAALPENSMPELKGILVAAMANAPRVIAAGLNLELSDTNVTMQRAPMLPSFGGGASENFSHEHYMYPNAKGTPDDPKTSDRAIKSLNYNVGLNQALFHWGALKKGYQSAQLQRAISERNVSEARRLLAMEVRQTYFQLISATNARELEKKGLADLEKERDSLRGQAKDGFVIQGTVTDADARIESYKLLMRGSENAYQSKWKLFRQLTGIDALQPSSALPREVSAVPTTVGEQMEKLSEKADGYRPAILVNADDSIKTEQLNYEIYKTRLKPQLGFSVSASQSNATPDNNVLGQKQLVTAYGASANVNWSIFDGFTTQALKKSSLIRIRQLKIARDQAELDYADSLKTQVETMRIGWINLKKTEEALLGARSNVEVVQKDFEVGMVPQQALDVAKAAAEAALQTANIARADYYMQIVNYLSLKGKDPAVTLSAK